MTAKTITKELYTQLEEALERIDELENKMSKITTDHNSEVTTLRRELKDCKNTIEDLKNIIEEKDKKIKELTAEILRLRTNNKKDSTNSSKPSGSNGYKTITNSRSKSTNKKGKPKGQSSTNFSKEKYEKFINSGDIEYKTVEVNKTKENEFKKPYIARALDIKIVKTVTEYRYYPDKNGNYNVPFYHNKPYQYGENLKTICSILNNEFYNSTDGIVKFIEDITNNGISLSKSTLLRWNKQLSVYLTPEKDNIESKLLNAYYVNCDDSCIKIDGINYYDLCICNNEYTRLWVSDKKDSKSWKEKTFIGDYKGIIVKDGTDVFNNFGIALAQCASHISRHNKGIYDFNDHKGARKMDDFIKKCIHERKQLIVNNKNCFTPQELDSLYKEFQIILKNWVKEWKYSTPDKNGVYNDEKCLLCRYEDEEEREEILYFINDFNVPATNSQAEVDQRGVKIKQKIGKFRSVDGAETYVLIKSCILTYKKHKVNVLKALKQAFLNHPIIV